MHRILVTQPRNLRIWHYAGFEPPQNAMDESSHRQGIHGIYINIYKADQGCIFTSTFAQVPQTLPPLPGLDQQSDNLRELGYWLVILAEICGRTDRKTETVGCQAQPSRI